MIMIIVMDLSVGDRNDRGEVIIFMMTQIDDAAKRDVEG